MKYLFSIIASLLMISPIFLTQSCDQASAKSSSYLDKTGAEIFENVVLLPTGVTIPIEEYFDSAGVPTKSHTWRFESISGHSWGSPTQCWDPAPTPPLEIPGTFTCESEEPDMFKCTFIIYFKPGNQYQYADYRCDCNAEPPMTVILNEYFFGVDDWGTCNLYPPPGMDSQEAEAAGLLTEEVKAILAAAPSIE